MLGCLGTVALVWWGGIAGLASGAVGETAIRFLPFGLLLDPQGAIPIAGAARNLVAVTGGNIVGGTLLVAGVYWVAYLRGARAPASGEPARSKAHDTSRGERG